MNLSSPLTVPYNRRTSIIWNSQRRTWGGEGGGLIRSEGKYELEWLKQFNADKDERFI